MSPLSRPALTLLSVLVLAGCFGEGAQDPEIDLAVFADEVGDTPFSPRGPADQADGVVVGPEEVVVFVGDELDVALSWTDQALQLRPAALPEDVRFESDESSARVRWEPEYEDVGSHDFVFLVVDAEDPNLIIATKTMVVDVIPELSLIEYGF